MKAPVLFFHDPNETVETTLEGKLVVALGNLRHGFRNAEESIALFTEDDLFGESRPAVSAENKKSSGKFP